MPGSDYWKKRFELLEDAMNNKGAQYMKDSEAIYRKAISNTEKEISRWYTRFADNEGISYQRAVEMLTGVLNLTLCISLYCITSTTSFPLKYPGPFISFTPNPMNRFHLCLSFLQFQL